MNLFLKRAICCGVAILCFGCGKKTITEARLSGSYQVKFPHGNESLILNSDKTFVQIYTPKANGQADTNKGTWEFHSKYDDVILTGALLYDDRAGHANTNLERTVWDLPVMERFGQISLSID